MINSISNPFEQLQSEIVELKELLNTHIQEQKKQQEKALKKLEAEAPQVYSKTEVKEIFGITDPTLDKWCINGNLTKIKIEGSRRVYFSKSEVNKLQTIKNAK